MGSDWKLTVYGVRGSAPRASRDFMEYGGNTSCFSVERGGDVLILDAGTGLAALGAELVKRHCLKRLDILLGHLHLDHVLGLLSFQPLLREDTELHFYGCAGFERALSRLISPPLWPLELHEFPARTVFHEITPGESLEAAGFTVSTMAGNHPDGSILLRLEGSGKRLVYALDCETDEEIFTKLAEFARGSDMLIWDANFAPGDLKPGWGHSTWEQGIRLASEAGVGRVLMSHFSSGYTDEFMHGQEKAAGAGCIFAKEGQVFTI